MFGSFKAAKTVLEYIEIIPKKKNLNIKKTVNHDFPVFENFSERRSN